MTEEHDEQLTALKNLVLSYEYEEQEISSVPSPQKDYFGYSCLSNTLMFKEPRIPDYDSEGITKYLDSHNFSTLDSLISYVKSLTNDVDKLFAIFLWESTNIKYDVDSLLTGEQRDKSLEIIFQNKAAVCEGYCLFFREMAQRTGVNSKRVKIRNYYTYSKSDEYLQNIEAVEPNHCSLFIEIDYVQYISDPTKAAGRLISENQFEFDYQPSLFLVPLIDTIGEKMPCDDYLVPFHLTLPDFLRACSISPIGIHLKTESNPFYEIESNDGYVTQIYSCIAPVGWIKISIQKQDEAYPDVFNEIQSDTLSSYEIVQEMIPNHPERCRIRTNVSLPDEGLYKIDVFIDSLHQVTYFVNNKAKSEMPIPLTYNPFNKAKFIPIKPSRLLSRVKRGVALIRFAVSIQKSDILWNIIKLNDDDGFDDDDGQTVSREYAKFLKLKLDFDNSRYEDQLAVSFPSNGRFCIQIYLANEEGSFSLYQKYFIDVDGAPSISDNIRVISPVNFLTKNRHFPEIEAFDANKNVVKISPNKSCHIIYDENELHQEIQLETVDDNQNILLELRKEKNVVAIPKLEKKDGKTHTFSWDIPNEEYEYQLFGFIDEAFLFNIKYVFTRKELRDESEAETQILDDLKQKVLFDQQYESIYGNKSDSKDVDERKSSSKCCLLI